MKKLLTILMLVAVLFVGGATVDAKTTKKKAKARTTQTSSSALWNGDIPSALFIYSLNDGHPERNETEFKKHGYKDDCAGRTCLFEKSNICKVFSDADGAEVWQDNGVCTTIWIKDSSSRNKLYNDLKKLIAQKGTGKICSVSLSDDGEIVFVKEPGFRH